MSFTLKQAIITQYNTDDPRMFSAVQVPDNFMLNNVRLPQTLCSQGKPGVGSLVLIGYMDSYVGYVVAILRESRTYITKEGYLRASTTDDSALLQPGEVFMESYGDPASAVPGTGCTFYMGNNGTITLTSGQTSDYIIIGGRDQDEDREVVINTDNGFFQSNIDDVTNIQSVFQFDDLNNIKVANQVVTTPDSSPIPVNVSVNELTMDFLGNVVLRNLTTGVTNSQLKFDVLGNVTLSNPVSSLTFSDTGAIALTGPTVNINNGTMGAARLNDFTLSNVSLDPTYWSMVTAMQAFFTALSGFTGSSPVPFSALGALGLAYIGQVPVAPVQMVGKINSASSTVKVGG